MEPNPFNERRNKMNDEIKAKLDEEIMDQLSVLSDMDGPQMMEAVRKKAYNGKFNKLNYP